MRNTFILCTFMVLLSAASLLSDPTADELAQNRHAFDEIRKNQQRLAHLRQDAKVFFGLPDARRLQLISLDESLSEGSSPDKIHLRAVMDRFADWFDRLDSKDRQSIQNAPDPIDRLKIIRELKDKEWMASQPRVRREQYAKLSGEAKNDFIKKLRAEERDRRLEWMMANRFWKELEKGATLPCRLSDFPAEVVTFVNEYLKPALSKAEEERLEKAQG